MLGVVVTSEEVEELEELEVSNRSLQLVSAHGVLVM